MSIETTPAQRELTRKRFIQGSAAAGGGVALAGPLSALAARSAQAARPQRDPGYGPLRPTREEDSRLAFIALPEGFRYRVISRQGDPSFVVGPDGSRTQAPTPGIFDGMAAYPGRRGETILIRNHENRERDGEIPFAIPPQFRYDANPGTANAGNTKLVVTDRDRRVRETFQVLAGTSTNCAGGETPYGSWIASEETFKEGGPFGHGYNFELPSASDEPTTSVPIRPAGRFSHEAVTLIDNVLYQTEDRSQPGSFTTPPPGAPSPVPAGYGGGGFYRYRPNTRIRRSGDLARSDGPLEMLGVRGQPNKDMDTVNPGETLRVRWYLIDQPEPSTDNPGSDPQTTGVRYQGQNKGAASFGRPEGTWEGEGKVYFACTAGGEPGLGQLWEYDPRRDEITLLFESANASQLEAPDNVVYVPRTGDVFLQEDGSDPQFVRGVTQEGRIYDFASTIINDSEFCGGCFSPDGNTLFLNQQGGRGLDSANRTAVNAEGALTYAIWGPFADGKKKGKKGKKGRNDDRDRDDRGRDRDDD